MRICLIENNTTDRDSHWALLGFLRFLLASAVVFSHIYQWFTLNSTDYFALVAKATGLVSVIAFLVVSGYSIASSFDRQQEGFYRRRMVRVLPLYVLAIVFSYLIKFIPYIDRTFEFPSLTLVFGNLFFLQGFIFEPIKTNPVVWTLSIEIFFYILTPFLYILSKRGRIFPLACISTLLFCNYKILSRYFFPQLPGFQDLLFGEGAILLGWAWLLGFYFFFERSNKLTYRFLLPGILAVGLLYSKDLTGLIIYLITCLCLIYGAKIKLPDRIRLIFSQLGDISYPLYLFHFPILIVLKSFLEIMPIFFYLATIIISLFLDEYYDKPIKNYLKYL